MTGKWVREFGGWWLVPQPERPERFHVRGHEVAFVTLENLGIGLNEPARIAKWIVSTLPSPDRAVVSRIWMSDVQRALLALVHSPFFEPISDLTRIGFSKLYAVHADGAQTGWDGSDEFPAPIDSIVAAHAAPWTGNTVARRRYMGVRTASTDSFCGTISFSAPGPVILRGNYPIGEGRSLGDPDGRTEA